MTNPNKNALTYIQDRSQRDPEFAEGVRIEFDKLELARKIKKLQEKQDNSKAEVP